MAERGVDASADRIVLTDSGTHAIDLVCRFLIEPGDTVLVDDPCYFNFLAVLRAHRARIVGVPMTPTGLTWRISNGPSPSMRRACTSPTRPSTTPPVPRSCPSRRTAC